MAPSHAMVKDHAFEYYTWHNSLLYAGTTVAAYSNRARVVVCNSQQFVCSHCITYYSAANTKLAQTYAVYHVEPPWYYTYIQSDLEIPYSRNATKKMVHAPKVDNGQTPGNYRKKAQSNYYQHCLAATWNKKSIIGPQNQTCARTKTLTKLAVVSDTTLTNRGFIDEAHNNTGLSACSKRLQ